MAEGGDVPFQPVPFQITDPERIPAKRYYDEEFYRLECERVWPHVWQMACRQEQIPNVGDYIEYSNLGKSVIVMRTRDGIKAFHNACRHRGVELIDKQGHGNCAGQGLVCPFHGWRWNTEGKNTFVYGRHMYSEKQLDPADIALKPCRHEMWGGFVFINHDDNAPGLRETMGPIAERLEKYNVDKMRAEWWFSTELPANWKIAMEAFMEGYHVLRTHPQLYEAANVMYNSFYGIEIGGVVQPINPGVSSRDNIIQQFRHMELVSKGMAGMCHAKDVETARGLLDVDLPEDPTQAVMTWFGMLNAAVTEQGRARGEPTPDLNALAMSDPVKSVEFFFPHFFMLPFLSSMSSYRIRPTGPETCIFELWSYTLFPEGQEPPPVMEPKWAAYNSGEYPEIPAQDYSNIPRQQLGLHAEGFEFMRLAQGVEGMISNYQRIIDGYLKGAPPAKLATAVASLTSNFDGVINEINV